MPATSVPDPAMTRQQLALSAFIISPLVVLVLLCYAIAVNIGEPRKMNVPPIGAGAGNTGGANAIGELLAHGRTTAPGEKPSPQPAATPIEPESLAQGFLLIVEDKSGKASPASPIYLASNFGNWNPGDPAYKLEPQSDMKWRILVKRPANRTDRMEFKFTRGSWELEELNADLSTPGNRTLPMLEAASVKPGEPPRIELVIHRWSDEKPGNQRQAADDPYRPMSVSGTVRRLEVAGGAGVSPGTARDLLVWLPPGYGDARNTGARYPVLYLHDGQNVFEKHPGIPEEWRADETAGELIAKGRMSPIIIVAIPHSGKNRNAEYLPVEALPGIKPLGDLHIDWLVSHVMPRVERAFRVKTGPENTAVGGASLGAIISLYAATQRPDVFGLVLAESLPLRAGATSAWDAWLSGVKQWPRKVFLGVGGTENGPGKTDSNRAYAEAVQALDKTLDKAGLGPDRRLLIVDQKAEHNEVAWAKRFPDALRFLFPPPMDGTK